jgi:hypothetical protein
MAHVMWKLTKGILYGKGLRLGALDGYERLIAAIYGTPDRVPVLLQPYLYAMRLNGLSIKRFFSEPIPFIHASCNTVRYFGVDAWSPVFDFYNIEAEALGQNLRWVEDREPTVNTHDPLIKEKRDLDSLKPPVPGKSGRMPFVLEAYKRYIEIMGMPPICYCCSPFTMAVLIRGLRNLIVDMHRDPRFVNDLMDFLSMEVVVPWIKKMIRETGASMVVMSDAQASPPIVSPGTIREFCLPYVEKVISATSTPRCTVIDTGTWGESHVKHPEEVLDIKMDMMLSGNTLNFMRPYYLLVWQEDYDKVGIPLIRSYAEARNVCLMLNTHYDILRQGVPESIAEMVRRLMREGAGKGKFAVLINMVTMDTPVENVHAAVEGVKQFGRYPIPDDLERRPFRMPSFAPFDQWVKEHGLPVDNV